MMSKEDKVDYTKNDLFAAIKLPYGTGQYNMVVFLPGEGKTSQDVIDKLSAGNWANWMGGFESTDHVVITMPRFKYSFEIGLNQVLSLMGMPKAFSSSLADFSKISDIDLYISSAKHKSFIDVNENGTEAAAVTSITFTNTSIGPAEPPKTYFTVDKPFVYAITEKDTEAILFIGEVTNPVYE
jgi:serpin B